MRRALRSFAVLAALPAAAAAQGGLGVQGYGYPTGQISSAALAVGGANAEVDAASQLNPAAVGLANRFAVYMQYQPEFRRTTIGGGTADARTMRFPSFQIAGGQGRLTVALSASTFLDRTWRNEYSDSVIVGGSYVPSTIVASSEGAITDARLAASYTLSPRVQVGVGLHALVGKNDVEFGRNFPDSTGVGDVAQLSTMSYAGGAVSLGIVSAPVEGVLIGASFRKGGSLEARQSSTEVYQGDAPDRLGLSVLYTGIPNTTFAARFDRTNWSAMSALGSAQMSVFDANDLGLGVEVVGPRVAGVPSYARLGLRSRGLPFGANGDQVSERSLSGGIGIPVARGRGVIDLSLQRATRSAAGANERAWSLGIGLGIKP